MKNYKLPGCSFLRCLPLVLIVFLSFVFCLLFSVSAFAGASISLSGGTWAIGTKGPLSESQSAANPWTVTNDSRGTEDILINVSSTGTWTASNDGTQTVIDEFVLRANTSSGQIITANNSTLVSSLGDTGEYSYGLWFKAPKSGSGTGLHTLTVTLTATNWAWFCGDGVTVAHTAGTVAPATATITYGTVTSSLSGASKCWITQNLGASQQAASATDAADASAGWYWQFNHKQGYAVGPTPAWTLTLIVQDSNWTAANDPCSIELGSGWRLPTLAEWTNAIANDPWANYTDAYNSVLKLHAAGSLNTNNGGLSDRGSWVDLWSSTSIAGASANGNKVTIKSDDCYMFACSKAYGFSVRCIKD